MQNIFNPAIQVTPKDFLRGGFTAEDIRCFVEQFDTSEEQRERLIRTIEELPKGQVSSYCYAIAQIERLLK